MTYKKGRQFEYDVKNYLVNNDWVVRRSYASKGIFDLLAWQGDAKFGIQCKSLSTNKNRSYLNPKENKELIKYSMNPPTVYEFVEWNKKYHSPVMNLLNDTFAVVHAYNTFPGIGWRILVQGEWNTLLL